MPRVKAKVALRQIRTLYTLGSLGGLPDACLLEMFLTHAGDDSEDAFSALVDRHGPMVLAVCRRMLKNTHDSEDAFQATFFILAAPRSVTLAARETGRLAARRRGPHRERSATPVRGSSMHEREAVDRNVKRSINAEHRSRRYPSDP